MPVRALAHRFRRSWLANPPEVLLGHLHPVHELVHTNHICRQHHAPPANEGRASVDYGSVCTTANTQQPRLTVRHVALFHMLSSSPEA